eukprot:gene16480-22702_t
MAVERRGVGVGAFALLMLWVSLIWPALGKLACEESGYCSLGKTKQFVGDISQPGNLRKLLESTAYKQEIILIQMSGSKVYIEMMLQLRADFKELGMSHVVVLSSKEDICRAFLSFDADMSCVWDGSLLHDASFAPYERTIHGRLRFMARTGRMGYNVMSFDSDFHIYRDPYPYLKGYPMQNKTLDDCPDCPWWPDEDQAAASKITEAFAFVPRWFVSSAWLLNTGYLTPLDGGEARQVAVHAHAVPGTFGSQHMKIGVRRPYNRYHFELSRELHSHPNGPTYLKSTGPYLVGLEAPKRLLMLHPDVDLSWVANPEEYRIITLGLMQLAMLSSRAVVFPDLPCNTSMVFDHGNESR